MAKKRKKKVEAVKAYAGLLRGEIVLPHISPTRWDGWVPVFIVPDDGTYKLVRVTKKRGKRGK